MTSPILPTRAPWRLAALSGALLCATCGGGGGSKPNVLLITLDTTRPDRMGVYGHEPDNTPVMTRLASEGARFDRAVSTAGITPMSHSSILTGLNNYRHGMRVFYSDECSHTLKEEVDSLPEILGPRGYATAAFVSAYPVSAAYNLDQGFETFDSGVELASMDLTGQQRHDTTWDTSGESSTQRRGDLTTDRALAWLDERGTDGPWCMWLHMFDAHDFSLVPPEDFAAEKGIQYPERGSVRQSLEWRERMYDPEIEYMDRQVGRLVAWLEEHGQLDDTVLVITADHGQGLSDGKRKHGWLKHRLLYDWSVRVPMIVRGPEVPVAVVDAHVRTIDVLPTILEAANAPLPASVDGESMLPLARGEAEAEPRIAYADALNLLDHHSPPRRRLPPGQYDNLFMASDGRWKLIWHQLETENSQLFDLAEDPDELQNLYAPDHPQARRLKAYLDARQPWRVERPLDDGGEGPSADALRGLGYGGGDDEDEEEEDGR